MNKKILFIINFVIALSILVVLFNKIGWQDVMENIKTARWDLLAVACGLALFFRIGFFPYIWKKILDYSSLEISYFDLLKINAASLPLKFLVPFKISEVVRAAGLRIFSKQDFATALGSTILLRVMILISTLEILFVGAVLNNKTAIGLGTCGGILITIMMVQIVASKSNNLMWLNSFIHCFKKVSAVRLVKLNFLSLIFQLGEVICAAVILFSFGIKINAIEVIYYLGIMMLATSLPISVQGLGIRESVAIIGLASVNPSVGLSFGVLQSVVYHILPAVVGGFVWLADWTVKVFYSEFVSGFIKSREV